MSKKLLVFLGCFLLVTGFLMADFVTVTPAAFDDDNDDPNTRNTDMWGTYLTNTAGAWFLAPVHLPDGVTLLNIRLHYLDSNAGANIDIYCNLIRVNKYTGGRDYLFQTNTSGPASGSIRSVVDNTCPTPAWRLVRNNACNYYILIGFNTTGSSLRVYGVTIEY
jgi:hypothetical protein